MERPTHRQLSAAIEVAMKQGQYRLGYPTPADCAAAAVLRLLEAPETATSEWRSTFERDGKLRDVIGLAVYHRFGPTYSPGYDGPRPIDERFYACADDVLCKLRWRGVLRDPLPPSDGGRK